MQILSNPPADVNETAVTIQLTDGIDVLDTRSIHPKDFSRLQETVQSVTDGELWWQIMHHNTPLDLAVLDVPVVPSARYEGNTAVTVDLVPVQVVGDGGSSLRHYRVQLQANGRYLIGSRQGLLDSFIAVGGTVIACVQADDGTLFYFSGRVQATLWEWIYENHGDLFELFNLLGDGIDLDPLAKTAVFQSASSVEVFGRCFPDYAVDGRFSRVAKDLLPDELWKLTDWIYDTCRKLDGLNAHVESHLMAIDYVPAEVS